MESEGRTERGSGDGYFGGVAADFGVTRAKRSCYGLVMLGEVWHGGSKKKKMC